MGITLAGIEPISKGFDNYRDFFVYNYWNYEYISEGAGLSKLQHKVDQYAKDYNREGHELLATIIVVEILAVSVGSDLLGQRVKSILSNPAHADYEDVSKEVDLLIDKYGKNPTVLDSDYYILFLMEVCIQYGLDIVKVMGKVNTMYPEAVQKAVNHLKNGLLSGS